MLAAHQVGQALAHGTGGLQFAQVLLAAHVFADGDKLHFRRDDAALRVMHLRDVLAGNGAARLAVQVKTQLGQFRVRQAGDAVVGGRAGQFFRVGPLHDPRQARRVEARADVDLHVRIRVGAGGVVHVDRRILFAAERCFRVGLADSAHGHADVGAAAFDIDLARIGQRRDGGFVDRGGGGEEFRVGVQFGSLARLFLSLEPAKEVRNYARGKAGCVHPKASLRWHYPDQVRRVFLTRACTVFPQRKAGPLAFAALRQRANYTRFTPRGQMISCRCSLCASTYFFLPQRQAVGSPFSWQMKMSAATMATSYTM